jgi:hypothetical protein
MVPRRNKRISSAQKARYKAAAEKSIAKQMVKEARRELAKGIQEFAVRSMNNLAKDGPAWTGEFSQSWVFISEGESAQSLTAGGKMGIGKYNKNDVPLRKIEKDLKSGKDYFKIVNTASHAAIAIDEEEGFFMPPLDQLDPVGDVVQYGTGRPRQEHFRWQIESSSGEQITSQITAEKDWFATYALGGQLKRDLSEGVALGFSGKSL